MIDKHKARRSHCEITVIFDWKLVNLSEKHLYQNTTQLLARELRTNISVHNIIICDETTPYNLSCIDGTIPYVGNDQKLREFVTTYIQYDGSLDACFKHISWL